MRVVIWSGRGWKPSPSDFDMLDFFHWCYKFTRVGICSTQDNRCANRSWADYAGIKTRELSSKHALVEWTDMIISYPGDDGTRCMYNRGSQAGKAVVDYRTNPDDDFDSIMARHNRAVCDGARTFKVPYPAYPYPTRTSQSRG